MTPIITFVSTALFVVSLHASPVLGDSVVEVAKDSATAQVSLALATPVLVTADGEVRKVDKTAGKVTLKHGRIENLDMPAMTMVFTVASPKLLDKLSPGDKVHFHVERAMGTLVVTEISNAQ